MSKPLSSPPEVPTDDGVQTSMRHRADARATNLTLEETAEALGNSRRTVSRSWREARAWLQRELTRGGI